MTQLTRTYNFSASHRLDTPALTPEENRRLFGKCNNLYGHGHNYRLHVTVEGPIDPRTGLVVSPLRLDEHVARQVLERVEHANLNTDVAEFGSVVATTENLGVVIGAWLQDGGQALGSARLRRLRIEETGSNTIEVEFP